MTTRTVHIREPLPYFAEIPYYLWGQVNYDSEGDCKKPTDREWTWIWLENRETQEVVEIRPDEGGWILEGYDEAIARLSIFLNDRCGSVAKPSAYIEAGEWNHPAALARASAVRSEFEQPALTPFDSHMFWGSWKWIGWFGSEFTWVGRWIMHSVVRGDTRAIPLCIDWIKDTRFQEQADALAYAVQRLSGEPARSPREWVRWYEGGWWTRGARQRFPQPDVNAWLADLKRQCGQE